MRPPWGPGWSTAAMVSPSGGHRIVWRPAINGRKLH